MDRKNFVLSYPHGCRDVSHEPAIEQLIKNETACLGISPGEDSGRERIRKQNAEF